MIDNFTGLSNLTKIGQAYKRSNTLSLPLLITQLALIYALKKFLLIQTTMILRIINFCLTC
jgi:hypothetical protein